MESVVCGKNSKERISYIAQRSYMHKILTREVHQSCIAVKHKTKYSAMGDGLNKVKHIHIMDECRI